MYQGRRWHEACRRITWPWPSLSWLTRTKTSTKRSFLLSLWVLGLFLRKATDSKIWILYHEKGLYPYHVVMWRRRRGGVYSHCYDHCHNRLPSQHCILAPQGPHAVLLVSAWARVCVLGTWRVPSGLAPSAVGGEIIRANPRFARLRQIEVHPLAATFRERPSTGWS